VPDVEKNIQERTEKSVQDVEQKAATGEAEPSSGVAGRVSQTFRDTVGDAKAESMANAKNLAAIFGTAGGIRDEQIDERTRARRVSDEARALNEAMASEQRQAQSDISFIRNEYEPEQVEISSFSPLGTGLQVLGSIGSTLLPYGDDISNWWFNRSHPQINPNQFNWIGNKGANTNMFDGWSSPTIPGGWK
jgi:hypothetical protein